MLKTYMGYSELPEDGAVLIFAHNAREAKRIGYPVSCGWGDCDYIDYRAKLLRNHVWLFKEADQEKLKTDIAHVNDNPATCKSCELWGSELDAEGVCLDCREEEAFNKKLDEKYKVSQEK